MESVVVDHYRLCGHQARREFQREAAKVSALQHPRICPVAVLKVETETPLVTVYALGLRTDCPNLEVAAQLYIENQFSWSHSEIAVLLLHIGEALHHCLSHSVSQIQVDPYSIAYSNAEFQLILRMAIGREGEFNSVYENPASWREARAKAVVWSLGRVALSLLRPDLMRTSVPEPDIQEALNAASLHPDLKSLLGDMLDFDENRRITISQVVHTAGILVVREVNAGVVEGGDIERILKATLESQVSAQVTFPCRSCHKAVAVSCLVSNCASHCFCSPSCLPTPCSICPALQARFLHSPSFLHCMECGREYKPSNDDIWRLQLADFESITAVCSIECLHPSAKQLLEMIEKTVSISNQALLNAREASELEREMEASGAYHSDIQIRLTEACRQLMSIFNGDSKCHFCERSLEDSANARWIICGTTQRGICSRECILRSFAVSSDFADTEATFECPRCHQEVTGKRVIETLGFKKCYDDPSKASDCCTNCYDIGTVVLPCGHLLCSICEATQPECTACPHSP